MSGTVRSAEQAREQLGERAGRVHVVDSASACGGEGLVALAAAAAARGGADGATVAERAREARSALKMWFAIDTLEYLRRGGRIAGAQAWLGSALRIKPILTVESEITPVERVRTSKRAFERMVDLLRSRAEDGADAYMVQHIQAPEQAQELAARATEIFGVPPRVISEIGPVIGTHVGPGLLGAGGLPSSLLSARGPAVCAQLPRRRCWRRFLRPNVSAPSAAMPPPITNPATPAPISTCGSALRSWARQSVSLTTSTRRCSTAVPSSRRLRSIESRISSGRRAGISCRIPTGWSRGSSWPRRSPSSGWAARP